MTDTVIGWFDREKDTVADKDRIAALTDILEEQRWPSFAEIEPGQ